MKPGKKQKKRIYIFGIPLTSQPGDRPEDAPAWFQKWWDRFINFMFDVAMAFFLVDLYLFFELVSQLNQSSASGLPWLH